MEDDKHFNSLQENLRLLNKCPVCQNNYKEEKKNILERRDTANLVHITCRHCQYSVLAVVTSSSFGSVSLGMVTDLGVADVARLKDREAVTEDELLDFYQALKNNLLF